MTSYLIVIGVMALGMVVVLIAIMRPEERASTPTSLSEDHIDSTTWTHEETDFERPDSRSAAAPD